MLTKQMKLAAVLVAAMSTSALAQEAAQVETAEGQTVIVPADAAEAGGLSPVATAVVTDFPVLNQDMNDQTIAETLIAQGFGDIYILREGSLMTVTATRDGNDIKLVYNLVEGRLIEVNGERILTEEERTLDNNDGGAAAPAATDEGDDEATDGTDDATDEATDDATDDATDGTTDDATDATDDATDAADDATDAADDATDGATDGSSGDAGTDDGGSTDGGSESGDSTSG